MVQQEEVVMIEPTESIHKMLALEASIKSGDGEEDILHRGVNSLWRQKVALWCYQVIDHLEEERSTVYVAMNILDRYSSGAMDEHAYEVASMTALFLSVRIAGSGELEMAELLPMSRKGISAQDVMSTGTSIISTLDLSKRIITPFDFISSLLDHLPSSLKPHTSRLRERAFYLAEMAVCDTILSSCKASELAYIAMLNSVADIVSHSEACIFGSTLSKTIDVLPSSKDVIHFRNRLQGIYHRRMQDSRAQSARPIEVQPKAQEAQASLVRVVSVDDLQEYSKQRSGEKRCLFDHDNDEVQIKRSKRED